MFIFRGAKVGKLVRIPIAIGTGSPKVRKMDLDRICCTPKQLNCSGNRYICVMETQELTSEPLNKQQLLMLRLFKRPMPEDSFEQIRDLAVKLLANQVK